ncbi:Zinc finger SWIM-type [Arabidopsis suecica]|uniref:Zinc finger SWIM-type n=1 Tax=Arabidopsis suecica TaxID=45249 RepID=A0A8T1ZVF1_ARASU|nr:Zinc finger SWIM-type [Arabidopsis suecica]
MTSATVPAFFVAEKRRCVSLIRGGDEDAVIVIAGSWECCENGIWDFLIANECYARSISMSMTMSYDELIAKVTAEFDLSEMSLMPKLSYWLPSQLSMFSVNRRPPVIISSEMGIRNFLNVRRTAVHLNLLLSLQEASEASCSTRMRRVCVAAEDEQDPIHGDGIRMYSVETATTENRNENSGSQVRRRLFGEGLDKGKGVMIDEGGCSSRGMPELCVDAGPSCVRESVAGLGRSIEEIPGSTVPGIISLSNASTPSLSNYLSETNTEDELMLREFEALEKRQADLAKEKGQTSARERGKSQSDGESDAYFTDGVESSGSEENGLTAYELTAYANWGDLNDSDWSDDCAVPVMEEGGPSAVEEPQDAVISNEWMEEPRHSRERDVGDEVLAYLNRSLDKPLSLQDTDDMGDEVGTMPPTDAGPSAVEEPQDAVISNAWMEEPRHSRERHVRDDVLAYLNRSLDKPLSLEDTDDMGDEVGTMPPTDAEPVFDDVIDLTNTDGCAPVSAEDDAIYIGRVFKDKVDMQNTLAVYAIKRMFHFRQTRSDPRRLIFVCVDPRCRWRVFGHRVSDNSKNFHVRTMTLTHSCTIAARSQYGKQASAKVIGSVLEKKFANGLRGPRAADIPDIVLEELKVSVTYMKAWHAKEAAVRKSRGSDEESYKLLAGYMYLLREGNPGTVYKLEHKLSAKGSKQFKYLFFALGASIAGIPHMRKVVLVDGTAIKAKFKGVLLAASMQDANFQVYPIAFGIVDSENAPAWTWFFRQLSALLPDSEDLVIISDRHRAIYAGLLEVYPLAFHGACAVHIERNVKHFSGKGLACLVGKAARAFNVGEFKEHYVEICSRSKKCGEYLDAIPLEHWTQAYCNAKRYNMMSSNIAEALNSALAKIVELPIVSMVESIRTKLMQWFCFRRAKAKRLLSLPEPITPNVNKLMMRYHTASAGLNVKGVSDWSYQVSTPEGKSYYVDLQKKTCSCQQFQKLLIPCPHALAAARINGVHIPTLVGDVYKLTVFHAAYEQFIFPVPNQGDAEVPEVVEQEQFNPPRNPPGPGRRKKRRIPSAGENVGGKRRKGGPHKCSICYETGHNRATCSNPAGREQFFVHQMQGSGGFLVTTVKQQAEPVLTRGWGEICCDL